MKKISSLICVLALAFTLAACSAAVRSPYTRAGFMPDSSVKSVENVSERAQYSVKFVANENSTVGATYTLFSDESFLSTELSVYTSDGSVGKVGEKYYLFKTHTFIKGEYAINGETIPAENDVETAVYMTGLGEGFSPVFSSRTVKADSLEKGGNGLEVVKYDFEVSTTYDRAAKTATVDLEAKNLADNAKYSLLKDGETSASYTLSNVSLTDYIDNEAILFAPRAAALTNSTSLRINSIDALSKSLNNLSLVFTAAGRKEFKDNSYSRKDADLGLSEYVIDPVSTITLSLSINSTYSGSPRSLTFADPTEAHEYMRLLSMTVPATYNIGTFEFTIRSSEYGTR